MFNLTERIVAARKKNTLAKMSQIDRAIIVCGYFAANKRVNEWITEEEWCEKANSIFGDDLKPGSGYLRRYLTAASVATKKKHPWAESDVSVSQIYSCLLRFKGPKNERKWSIKESEADRLILAAISKLSPPDGMNAAPVKPRKLNWDPATLAIVNAVINSEHPVTAEQIAAAAKQPQQVVSHILTLLNNAGGPIKRVEKKRTWVAR